MDARAAALGLCPGMAVSHAQALVEDLHVAEADPQGDAAALARLAAWCLRQYSPLAAAAPPDGIWIDITGCDHAFGGEAGLLRHAAARLAEAGIALRAAVADTPGAAHALARHAAAPLSVAPPGETRAALAPLPPSCLRVADETLGALRTLGWDSVGQLLAAPRAPLAKRLGAALIRRLDQAVGDVAEPIEPMQPAELPRTRQGFPEPIATADDLARATVLLAERLCEKLRQRGLGASRVDLVFRRVDGADQAIRIGTAAATRDAAHLSRLLVAGIETVDPGFGIEAMALSAPLTSRLGGRQGVSDLCMSAQAPDLSGLVDMLANRLGSERVFRAAPVESDVPERAWRAVPPLARPGGRGWPARLPRPPRLFTPPWPITAMAQLPDHAPAQFVWRSRPHRVRHADGPERIFGEWWHDEAETWAVRDYFQVEDEGGQRFWLFRRGDAQQAQTGDLQWFLHGMFG